MTYKEIYDIAVPERKRKEERWNLFAGHIGRPLSVLMTVPLTKTQVKKIKKKFLKKLKKIMLILTI